MSFIVFSQQDEMGAHLRQALEASGHASVAATVSVEDEFPAAVRELRPDGILMDLGHAPHGVLDLVETLGASRPQLVACGPLDQSDVILRALKQGAREFLPAAPFAEEIKATVERLVLEQAPREASARVAPLLAVMGAKGGVGATVVACQLAASLQKLGGRTVLVDLNIPMGDVALHFDVQPSYTMADIRRDAGTLDMALVRGMLHPHRCGLQILAAPSKMEDAELVTDQHVHGVLEALRVDFEWVVVDVSRSWSESTVRALDMADEILLVTLQDVPTLTHARAHRELLIRLGHSPRKIHTIVNRASKRDLVSGEDLVQFLDSQPEMRLPNDYASTVTSVNEGRPVFEVAADSALDLAFQELARKVFAWAGVQPADAERLRSGPLSRIRKLFRRQR
jgi:pilus assembly protein CpaE